MRLDGLLRVIDPTPLAALAPWCVIDRADELAVEIKMQGDHIDLLSLDRALLRRLARIDACTDHDTLGRWQEQAVVAASAAEALR